MTINPAFLEVYEGEPIEVICDVEGIPTPTTTWSRVESKPLNFQHTFVNGVFRISQARQSDQGNYKWVWDIVDEESVPLKSQKFKLAGEKKTLCNGICWIYFEYVLILEIGGTCIGDRRHLLVVWYCFFANNLRSNASSQHNWECITNNFETKI